VAHFERRLRRLASKALRNNSRVGRWVQTGDVFGNASLRLLRALETERPQSVSSLLNLASEQIRRELIDLFRHHCGRHRHGSHHATTRPPAGDEGNRLPAHDRADTTWEPSSVARYAEFHEKVAALPEKERQVFGLLHYQGLTQEEVARVMNVSRSTVSRYSQHAAQRLREALGGGPPA
jgi:RNA polymerase sigma factor (sigma-70 family)